jgi:nitrite reductase (NADH) small subunit
MRTDISVETKLTPGAVSWFRACRTADVPRDGGACVLHEGRQIALFHFSFTDEWFATQNLCPHRRQMALARGMVGESAGEPKVACPFHKRTFSLRSGACLSDAAMRPIATYPVRIEDDFVYVGIPES